MTLSREDPTARLGVAEVAQISEAVVAEVERAVIGKREAIMLVLIGVLVGRSRALGGCSGSREDPHCSLACSSSRARNLPGPVHARPHAS